jgi:hypothetical protein
MIGSKYQDFLSQKVPLEMGIMMALMRKLAE